MNQDDQPVLDPYDRASIEPHYAALLDTPLPSSADIVTWLHRWSEMERGMEEADAAAFRAKNADTTGVRASERYEYLVGVIHPLLEQQRQACKQKLLNVEHYDPGPMHTQMLRKLCAESELFRAANAPLLAEEQSISA